jgi:hypothetical protein
VLGVLAKYESKPPLRKAELNKKLNEKLSVPFPRGVHWEIEFHEINELYKFFQPQESRQVPVVSRKQ